MKLAIVVPTLDDWQSLAILVGKLHALEIAGINSVRVVIVNDGSTTPLPTEAFRTLGAGCIDRVTVIDLVSNLENQRAIALGIAVVSEEATEDILVVMDGDGEDNPSDVPRLVAALLENPGSIVVAERAKRSEGRIFRAGYFVYTWLFRLLVGIRIRFGNFSAFGIAAAKRLARSPATWNQFAASVLRSRVPIVYVPAARSARYADKSSTNLHFLMTHGLAGFAVFSDRVLVRFFMLSVIVAATSIALALVVIFIRLFTAYAIPGWTTGALGILGLFIIQAMMLSLFASVLHLASRSQVGALPVNLIRQFVQKTTDLDMR